MKVRFSQNAKNAFALGLLCTIAYLTVYVARETLSPVTPQMLEEGFSESYIGGLSSVFFITYAIGQLINGTIGDKVKTRYMMSLGLLFASISLTVFRLVVPTPAAAYAAYAATGFSLSMIYAPMAKVVSENVEPKYARRCSMSYTFSACFGRPFAGLLAAAMVWQSAFIVGSTALFAMAIVCFFVFLAFERNGIVRYHQFDVKEKTASNLKILIERDIIRFAFIAILTGIVRTAVTFWLPTYTTQRLSFTPQESSIIYTVLMLVCSLNSFLSVAVYVWFKENVLRAALLFFSVSATAFLGAFFFTQPIVNLALMMVAILSNDAAAALIWSVYCPSLYDTGMTARGTGFLNFLSYASASAASSAFAAAVGGIGWGGLVLVWFSLMACGVVVVLIKGKKKEVKEVEG